MQEAAKLIVWPKEGAPKRSRRDGSQLVNQLKSERKWDVEAVAQAIKTGGPSC